jgi:hypothetical protein
MGDKMPQALYETKLVQADDKGNYVDLGKSYKIKITHSDLLVNRQVIPLRNILQVDRVGKGVSLLFLDRNNVKSQLFFTKSGFGRENHLEMIVEQLKLALYKAKAGVDPEEIPEEAPPDTCHECGERGGQPLNFGSIVSFFLVAKWKSVSGVYCKKHAARIGLQKLLTTWFLGWWSPWGLFFAPSYIITNTRSLLAHSSLPSALVYLLGAMAFSPLLIVVPFIVKIFR